MKEIPLHICFLSSCGYLIQKNIPWKEEEITLEKVKIKYEMHNIEIISIEAIIKRRKGFYFAHPFQSNYQISKEARKEIREKFPLVIFSRGERRIYEN